MLQGLARKVKDWLKRPVPAARSGADPAGTSETPAAARARKCCESGAAALRDGRPAEALALFDEAIALHPDFALAHDQAGLALLALRRPEHALARFQRALEAQYDYVPALQHQGVTCLELGRHEEAEDSFKLVLAHEPGSAQAWVSLAMACSNQGHGDTAVAHLRRALDLEPGLTEVRAMLARLLDAQGNLEEAAASHREVVAAQPAVPELHLNFGLTLLKLGRVDEAIARFEEALALKPAFPEAQFNLGNARLQRGDELAAVECYERALALRPDFANACINLASVLEERGEIDRAFEYYERAAVIDPASTSPHHNMGVLFGKLGKVREAITCYERAQSIRPGHPESELNLAITRLQAGDLPRGWEGYESRFRQLDPALRADTRPFPWPRWMGEPLAGKRILVWGEQGIGDEITFSTTYQEVIAAAQACVIECAPKLVPLFSRSFPGARVVAKSDPPHPETAQRFDYQCPAGSLPRWLRPDLKSFPVRRGHLAALPERVSHWRSRLERLGGGLRVGICWRSSNLTGDRALYCTRLDQWGPILHTPGVQFVCLQYDECREELAAAHRRFGTEVLAFAEVDLYNDLEEAAALTQAVDLVISAPTSVSLLAAALGVETWQMSYGEQWQPHGTDRNPWYPALTQFKRAWNQEWEEILELIAGRLRREAERRALQASAGDTAASGGPAPQANHDTEAITRLLHAVEIEPRNPAPLAELGAISYAAGRHAEALKYYEAASALDPGYAELHHNVALALQALNRTREAIDRFLRAAELKPDLCDVHFNAGIALLKEGEIARAIASFQRVIALQPDHAPAHNNLAAAYGAAGLLEKALASVRRSLALNPDDPEAICNLGMIFHHHGRLEEAIACYEQARSKMRDPAVAELNLGIARFLTGDFERGWAGYEWRFLANNSENRLLKYDLPYRKWQGEDLAGNSVLVWGEQGVGDQLLLASLLPEIAREAGSCVAECAPKLIPLFTRSFPDVGLIPLTDPPNAGARRSFDYQVSLGGIARWRRRDLDSFPWRRAYLAPDPGRVSHWQGRLAALGAGPNIGFCWRSTNIKGDRALKCTELAQWGSIFAVRGAQFVSLQYDECSGEIADAERSFGLTLHVFSDVDLFNDIDEAAALTRACDLVVTVPTAVSMLAAGLGVETWQMNYGPDWQTHGTRYHPWLPAMVRFDRTWNQSWEELIPEVAERLARWVQERTPGK